MPMTALLILIAVAHQCHCTFPTELLEKSESKLLTVILDGEIPAIDRGILKQFLAVTADKLSPAYAPA